MSLLRPDRLPERPKSPLILAREAAEGKSRVISIDAEAARTRLAFDSMGFDFKL